VCKSRLKDAVHVCMSSAVAFKDPYSIVHECAVQVMRYQARLTDGSVWDFAENGRKETFYTHRLKCVCLVY
jgi:hypothetical protein